MTKRITAALLSSMLIAGAFAGCGGGSGNDGNSTAGSASKSEAKNGQLELEFFQQQGEEAIQSGYQAVIKDFEEKNPDIKIQMNTVPDSLKVLASRIATDDTPPLLTDWPTQKQFKEKVKNGYYEKLTGQDFLTRVNKSYLDMSPAEDGEYYAMPYARNYMAVYYNVEIFEKNNITIPETYDEFIAACKKLKDAGITPLNFPLKDGVGHVFQSTNITWVKGGVEEMVKVSQGEGKLEGNAAFAAYGDKMLELMSYGNEDAFGMSTTMMQEAFANGQCAMIISGSYGRGNIKLANADLKFGAFPLPGDTKADTTVLTGVNAALCISASASKEQKEAGLKFMDYISQTDVAQKWSDTSGEPSIITGTTYNDELCMPILDFIDTTGQVHDWMASTLDNNVVNELYNTVQSFLLDKPSVDDFLKNMDVTIETAMQ